MAVGTGNPPPPRSFLGSERLLSPSGLPHRRWWRVVVRVLTVGVGRYLIGSPRPVGIQQSFRLKENLALLPRGSGPGEPDQDGLRSRLRSYGPAYCCLAPFVPECLACLRPLRMCPPERIAREVEKLDGELA